MTEAPLKILAFDIGIRNLAWCLMEQGSSSAKILGWQNYDLLTGAGHETPVAKSTCPKCSAAAKWQAPAPAAATCSRHCPATHPPLKDLSGNPLTKLPAAVGLRALVAAKGPVPKKATKVTLTEALRAHWSLPVEKVKLKKAVDHELTTIHDSMRRFVSANAESFRQATHILLENQPVLKNPTMKSVQILLFATLRDLLQPNPPVLKLVHAGKKVQGKTTGDAGYKSRKDASEAKVEELLGGTKVAGAAEWLAFFKGQAKKSDLADAFLMCWDRCGVSAA